MTKKDIERVFVFRRVLSADFNDPALQELNKLSDEKLLLILNSTVLPNAMSTNVLKFTYLFNLILTNKDSERQKIEHSMSNILNIYSAMSRGLKDIIKFGVYNGFSGYDWRYHFSRYLKNPSNPITRKFTQSTKKMTGYFFQRAFSYAYSLIFKVEKNDRFPNN